MDTLDRFLLREFTAYFVLIVSGLALIFLGVDFLAKFWDLQMPFSQVLELYLYKTPAAIQQFVPMGCLMATLLVLTNMSRQNEVLALYSSGIGTLRLVSTFVAAVATISTLSFLVFDNVVPAFTRKQIWIQQGKDPAHRDGVPPADRNGMWYRSGRLLYNVGLMRPETNTLENVNVYLISGGFQLLETIHARKAQFVDNDWVLEDGFVVTYPPDTHFPITKKFKRKAGIIPEKPTDFKTLKLEEDTMRLRDLRKVIQRNQSYGLDTTAQQVSYQERLALVFTPLVFVLLGIPFALKPLKSYSAAKSVAFCFLVVFLHLLLFRISLSIGKGGRLPAVVAAWAPNFLFLILSGFLIIRRN